MKYLISFFVLFAFLASALFETPPEGVTLAIWPAIALAAGSLFGSILSSNKTNSTNKSIADSQNQLNIDMMREQNSFNRQERLETQDYNRKLWLEQQKYASPINEAARLKAAGINPSAVLNGDSSSSMAPAFSSPQSSASFNGAAGYQYESPLSSMPSILSSLSGSLYQSEATKGLAIDNETKLSQNMENLRNSIADRMVKLQNLKKGSLEYKLLEKGIERSNIELRTMELAYDRQYKASQYDDQFMQNQLRAADDAHRVSTAQSTSLEIANEIQRTYGIKLADRQLATLEVGIRKAQAEIGLLSQQSNLTREQSQNVAYDSAKKIAETIGIRQNNKNFDRIVDSINSRIFLEGARNNEMLNFYGGKSFQSKIFHGVDFINSHFGLGNLRNSFK